jgi:NADPH:quinone reductase-like Zn-dependent oxidoreductase
VARDHGCDHVIVSPHYRFADAVQRHFGGADLVIDGLGQAAREQNMAALADCGHWVSLGQATGLLEPLAADWLGAKSITFSRPAVFHYVTTPEQLAERAARVWAALAGGVFGAPLVERFTLDAAGRAHERLESRASTGSLVLLA